MASLLGRSGQFSGVSIQLPPTGLALGREKSGAGCLSFDQDTDVSREHCSVRYDEGSRRFTLTDLGSSNGTFLMPGDRRLAPREEVTCEPGQLIRVGPHHVFQLVASEPARRSGWPPADPRNLLACMMVSVAILGAITTYHTARTEQHTTLKQQRLIQAQLIAQSQRQRLQAQFDLAREVHDRRNRAVALGGQLVDQGLPALAQTEFYVSRALYPVENQLSAADAGDMPIEQAIAQSLARTLSSYGFDFRYSRASADAGDVMVQLWTSMKRDAHESHLMSVRLAAVVVAFVFALMLLTFSDVTRPPAWKRTFAAASATAVAAAFVVVVKIGALELAWTLAGAAAVLSLLVALLWRRGLLSTKCGELSHPDEVEAPKHAFSWLRLSGESEPFARVTIVTIAITVMLSATAGFGYSLAEANAGAAALEAADASVQEILRTDRWAHAYRLRAMEIVNTLELETRAGFTRQLVEFAQRTGNRNALVSLQPQYTDYQRRYLQAPSPGKLVHGDSEGVDADPRFPERILAHSAMREDGSPASAMDADSSFAVWDARSTESTSWHTRATGFLAALTLFAIALYLFGQGHALGRKAAGGALFLTGVLFVTAALAFELSAVIPSKSKADDTIEPCPSDTGSSANAVTTAARYYSRGMAKLRTAHSIDEANAASGLLRCALHFRPSFGQARQMLSQALSMVGTIQDEDTYVTLPARRRLESMLTQDEIALHRFEDQNYPVPTDALIAVAYDRWLLALSKRKPEMLRGAASAIGLAVTSKIDGADAGSEMRAVARLNSAVINLALQRHDDADNDLDAAMREVADPDRSESTLAKERPELVASMITDLNTLEANCPLDSEACSKVSAHAERMKRCVAELLWTQGTGCLHAASSDVAAPSVASLQSSVEVRPAELLWRGVMPTPALAPERLRLLWLAWNEDWKTWRVLPESLHSSPVISDKRELTAQMIGPDYFGQRCYAPGKYAVEVYLDGRFVERQEATLEGPRTAYRTDHSLNLGTCLTSDMIRIAPPANANETSAETSLFEARAYALKGAPDHPALIFADLPTFGGSAHNASIQQLADFLGAWSAIRESSSPRPLTRQQLTSHCSDRNAPAEIVLMREDFENVSRVSAAVTSDASWPELCSMMASATPWMPLGDVKATSLRN